VSRRTPRVPASATANLRKRRIRIDAEPEDLQSLELGPRSRARFGTGYPVAGVRRESDLLAAASDERVGRKSNRDKIGRFPRLGVGVVSRCVSRLSGSGMLCVRGRTNDLGTGHPVRTAGDIYDTLELGADDVLRRVG